MTHPPGSTTGTPVQGNSGPDTLASSAVEPGKRFEGWRLVRYLLAACVVMAIIAAIVDRMVLGSLQ